MQADALCKFIMPKSNHMPIAYLLRCCICSVLILSLVFDSTAQRRASRRASPKTEVITVQDTEVEEDFIDEVEKGFEKKKLGKIILSDETVLPISRQTAGINKAKVADSYPFITEDGLRLYFTSNREGGHGRFFISTRKSVNDPFGDAKVLSANLTDGYYAGTLTADELTLCMVKEGSMYISIRKDKSAMFPAPVKLHGAGNEYHFGPSISANGNEIIVTVTIDGKGDRTRIYQRTGTYNIERIAELVIPKDGDAGPGQLSKDGLSYYLSIELNSQEYLWSYSRKTSADGFGNAKELPQPVKGLRNIIQPSLSGDGSVLVFVTSPGNSWDEDDILLVNTTKKLELPKLSGNIIAKAGNSVKPVKKLDLPDLVDYLTALNADQKSTNQTTTNSRKQPVATFVMQLRVYPNPFTSVFNLELNILPVDGALIYVYDESGKLIKQQKVNNIRTTISFNRSLPGSYTYRVSDSKGNLIGSGKIIKEQ